MVYPALLPLMRTPRLPVVDWADVPHWFKWTRPFRRKTKSGFCACAITFQLASTIQRPTVLCNFSNFNIMFRGSFTFTSPPVRHRVPLHFNWNLLPPMRTPRLPAVDWTDARADLNGLVRFAERRNLVSARVPSHFKRSLPEQMIGPDRANLFCSVCVTMLLSKGAPKID